MLGELFTLSTRSLAFRRLRSALTVLGVVIGVSLVLSLFLLGAGLREAVEGRLRAFGTDLLVVFPGDESSPLIGLLSDLQVRDRDVEAIADVPGVHTVMPIDERSLVRVSFRGEEKSLRLHAQPIKAIRSVFEESSGFRLREGEWPSNEDVREVVLGVTTADKTFDEPVRAGDSLEIKGRRFTVTGILDSIGEPNHDSAVFISLKNQRSLVGARTGVASVTVKLNPGEDPERMAEEVRRTLLRQPGIGDVSVLTSRKAGDIAGDIIGVLQLVLSGIAAVALVVGAVGVMNTMFTSVLERTREIGVMKAIGATDRAVQAVFVMESGTIGAIGGLIGTIAGAALAKAAEAVAHQQGFLLLDVRVDLPLFLMVFIGSFVLGTLSGYLPARRAARLSPVQALRYE